MNIKWYINRFNETKETYIGKTSSVKSLILILDYLGAFVRHGASFNDYFGYRFYELNRKGRKNYITLRRTRKLQNICNDSEKIKDFRDKINFNTKYSDYLGRKWLDVSSSSLSDFRAFLESVGDEVFVKNVAGLCGIGVERIKVKEVNPDILHEKLKNNKEAQFLLEEPIRQGGILSEIHPQSVNTIRITTVLDENGRDVNIMGAVLRIGRGEDCRDNLHSGGIAAQIDVETGIIINPGFDKSNKRYLKHPDSDIVLVGLQIPYWKECVKFIKEVARKSPDVRYVGWDVVIKGDGSFLLIEGNDNGDHDVQQLHYKGLWPEYQSVISLKDKKK